MLDNLMNLIYTESHLNSYYIKIDVYHFSHYDMGFNRSETRDKKIRYRQVSSSTRMNNFNKV